MECERNVVTHIPRRIWITKRNRSIYPCLFIYDTQSVPICLYRGTNRMITLHIIYLYPTYTHIHAARTFAWHIYSSSLVQAVFTLFRKHANTRHIIAVVISLSLFFALLWHVWIWLASCVEQPDCFTGALSVFYHGWQSAFQLTSEYLTCPSRDLWSVCHL